MRTYHIYNGHNGSEYTLNIDPLPVEGGIKLETERADRFSTHEYLSRDAAARLLRNWRRDPDIDVGRWR